MSYKDEKTLPFVDEWSTDAEWEDYFRRQEAASHNGSTTITFVVVGAMLTLVALSLWIAG
jgi:hypothetical protein